MRFVAAVTIGLLMLAVARPAAAAAAKDLVQAMLLAGVESVRAGKALTRGVLLKIKPGWHVYWTNPGDSGAPTRVKWNLPEGWKAAELQYPIPRRIELPGGVVNYGYEDEVMLLAHVTPPKDLDVGSTVELSADVSWLVCEEVCIPGKQQVRLALPLRNGVKPANEKLFEHWLGRMPVPAERLSGVGVDAEPLNLSSGSGSTDIRATLKMTDLAIPDAVNGMELTVGPPQPSANGTRYHVEARVLKDLRVTANKVEVLVGPYKVTIPIVGAATPATAPSTR